MQVSWDSVLERQIIQKLNQRQSTYVYIKPFKLVSSRGQLDKSAEPLTGIEQVGEL